MPKKVTTKKVAKKAVKKTAKKTTKKVAKKAVKKTTTKTAKKVTKNNSKKQKNLVCAPEDKCFWTTDGQVLCDLQELKLAFGSMDDMVFLHHVTKEKNDFAEWVEHVLNDAECAAALRKSRKPASAKTVVIRHLRFHSV